MPCIGRSPSLAALAGDDTRHRLNVIPGRSEAEGRNEVPQKGLHCFRSCAGISISLLLRQCPASPIGQGSLPVAPGWIYALLTISR